MTSKLFRAMPLATLLLVLTHTGFAQAKWPAVTQTAKPWTRWWWQGSAVDAPGLTAAMTQYKNAGLGGLEITPIYGVQGAENKFLDFLSPQWIKMLAHTLKEGKRLGLGIDMATGTGWPFGGPWIGAEDACKYLAQKSFELKGGETLQQKIECIPDAFVRTANGKSLKPEQLKDPISANANLQALAIDQVRFPTPLPLVMVMAYGENGQTQNITKLVDSNGKLNWKAPEGSWKVYALFQGLHGKMVERAAPGGEGNVIDHFEQKALNTYLEKFNAALKNTDLSGLRAWFNDSYEVDDARGQSDWTPNFLEQFSKRRGYPLEKYFPQLFSKENTDLHNRILYDYRLTISELLLDEFTAPWQSWAGKQGKLIRNQSHGSPGNILDLYSAIDIPETEGTNILRFKFATSAAHVSGKPLASAESATWLNDHFLSTLGDVKAILDKYFLGGVNHVFYHGTNYSPPNETWPGWLFYAAVHFHPNNPFWKDFAWLNQYVTRTQSFLQAGKPANDVLLYFPYHDRISDPNSRGGLLHHFDGMEGFHGTPFEQTADWMLNNGYAFDLFSDKQLESISTQNNQLLTGGTSYQTILVSGAKLIPLETAKKLINLAENGATILFSGEAPRDVPGFGNLEARRAELRKLIGSLVVENDEQTGITIIKHGKGSILLGKDAATLLKRAGIRKDHLPEGVQSIRRILNNGEYHFIANTGATNIEQWVSIATSYKYAALFDPMTGRSGSTAVNNTSNNEMLVFLLLKPGESVVLQTGSTPFTGTAFPVYKNAGESQPIGKTWKVDFISGGPVLPKSLTLNKLSSWTEQPGEAYKIFSGTARYTTTFSKPVAKISAENWKLNLGTVSESAEVFLNGKKLETLLGPTFELVIPVSLLKAENKLEIIVSNSMANRIIDLEKKGVPWKKFYNINFPANKAENRGADGLFSAAKWAPKSSGLLSEVTLTPVLNVAATISEFENKALK